MKKNECFFQVKIRRNSFSNFIAKIVNYRWLCWETGDRTGSYNPFEDNHNSHDYLFIVFDSDNGKLIPDFEDHSCDKIKTVSQKRLVLEIKKKTREQFAKKTNLDLDLTQCIKCQSKASFENEITVYKKLPLCRDCLCGTNEDDMSELRRKFDDGYFCTKNNDAFRYRIMLKDQTVG